MVNNSLMTKPKNKKMRESNIELYRIIAMLLIISHHYVVNSGLLDVLYAEPTSFKSLFLLVFGAFGKIGINCFVFITGYFMCTAEITAKKFAKLFCEVVFYKITINCIFWATSYQAFTLRSFLDVFIPIRGIYNDFAGTYLVFFLFIPFLNKLIKALNEKQHFILIMLLGFTYVFFATMPTFFVVMNYVSWYVVLFIIASYMRFYPRKWFDNRNVWALLTVGSVILSIASVIAGAFFLKWTGRNIIYFFVMDSNKFLALLVGISSFMLFKNIKIKQSWFINSISATCFGVLLIHGNSDVMRSWLWRDILDNVGMYNSSYWLVHSVLSVLLVFVGCSIIDLLRIYFIEIPLFKIWDKKWDGFLERYKKIELKVMNKLNISS